MNSCRTFEIYIESNCGSDVSSSSPITTVSTTGCGNCIELTYCEPEVTNPGFAFNIHAPSSEAGAVTNYEETIGWGKPINEDYIYGDLVIVDDGTANADEGCDPLVNGGAINGNIAIAMRGTCPFVDKALNAQNAGATGLIIVNNEPGLFEMGGNTQNVNIPVVMITQAQGNALMAEINAGEDVTVFLGEQNEYIESFELDSELNVSGDNGGYLAPGLDEIDLDLNQSYNFTMVPRFDGQPTDQYTRIWIDLNQDGDFTNNEIVYDQTTSSIGTLTDAFTVPGTADMGSTRLRVEMAYQGYGADPLSGGCDNFVSGEVEDYCVNIKDVANLTDNSIDEFILVYPNPASNLLNFKIQTERAATIDIIDATGKLVGEYAVNEQLTKINVHNFVNGLYIYNVKDSNGNSIKTDKVSIVR